MKPSPDLWSRHNVHVQGEGALTLLFLHGLGTNQTLWRRMAQGLEGDFRMAFMDLAGCGQAPMADGERHRYASLDGHAEDLVRVIESLRDGRLVLVVHSVACMIGLLAELRAPELVDAHVMIAPSPCYYNLPGYQGGIDADQIEATVDLIRRDVRAWSRTAVPMLMARPADAPASLELQAAFDQADEAAYAQFAEVTFRGDYRHRLPELVKPVLVMQCAQDAVAPQSVGQFMNAQLPDGHLQVLPVQGHYPQLTDPQLCVDTLRSFVKSLGLSG